MSSYDIFDYLKKITDKYKTDEKKIRTTKDFYDDNILPIVGNQYLSHIITSIRKWFREIVENDRLEIEIVGEEFVTIEADKGCKTIPQLTVELDKTVVSFRAVENGRPINPLTEYLSLTYIDISYSLLLESQKHFNDSKPEKIKKDLRLRLSHELSHIIIYGLLIDYAKKVRKRKWQKNEGLENIIKKLNREFEKNTKETILRSSFNELESLTSVMAIIMMAEKCRFHSDEYPKYIYSMQEIIQGMI